MLDRFLSLLILLMGGAAAGPAESESGGVPSAAGPAESELGGGHVAAPAATADVKQVYEDYELRTVPCGSFCVSTTVESFPFKQRTLLHMLSERLVHNFPCACCNYYSDMQQFCRNCQAPYCRECAYFIKTYCSLSKRCRWCGEIVPPVEQREQLDCEDENSLTPHQIAIMSAQEEFGSLGDWYRGIIRTNPNFDFSGIFWQSIFAAQRWSFFINANRFFAELPNQYDIMMANMVFHHSFFNLTHFQFRDNRKKFALVLQRCSSSNQEPSLFVQSRQMAIMNTMSVMMLEKMEKNIGTHFFDRVLHRVHAKCSLQLSNGLGVRLQPCQDSEDPEDDSWV